MEPPIYQARRSVAQTPTKSMKIGERFNPYKMFHGSWVPNWLMATKLITPGAKLCYARLARYNGKNGNCFPTIDTLADETGSSDRQVKRYIKELKKQKLLASEKPHFGASSTYIFLWHSLMESEIEKQPADNSQSGHMWPNREDSNRAISGTAKGPHMALLGGGSLCTLRESEEESHVPCVLSDKERLEKESTEIYQAYPRKVARPAALKAIVKALAKIPFVTLLEKTQLFSAAWVGAPKEELVYCPHPATWFNGERYNDDPSTWRRSSNRETLGSLQMQIKALEEAIERHPYNPDNRDDFAVIKPEEKAHYRDLVAKRDALREQQTRQILAR